MTTKLLDYSMTTYGLGRAGEPGETKTVSLIEALRAEHAKMLDNANTILRAIQVLAPPAQTVSTTSHWEAVKDPKERIKEVLDKLMPKMPNGKPGRSAASRKAQSLAMKRSWKLRKAGKKAARA